jgi:hypothetical protein
MNSWPVWKPGSILKAAHLLGAEDYLLARWGFGAEAMPGVERFHPGEGLRLERSEKGIVVRLTAVRGVTRDGQPVVVEDAVGLTMELPVGEQTGVTFDLAAVVNAPAAADKVSLQAAEVAEGAAPPVRAANELDLGRFGGPAGRTPRLIRRPLVRRFAALPDSAEWRTWVEPVRQALSQLYAQAGPPTTPAGAAFAAEFYRIGYAWPRLLIPELVDGLRYVGRLTALTRRPAGEMLPILRDPPGLPPAELDGDRLPQWVIQEAQLPAAGPEASRPLIEGVDCTPFAWEGEQLVVALAAPLPPGRLEVRVPVELVSAAGEGLKLHLEFRGPANKQMTRDAGADIPGSAVYSVVLTAPIAGDAKLRIYPITEPGPGGARPALYHREAARTV